MRVICKMANNNIEITQVPWYFVPPLWDKIKNYVCRGAAVGGVPFLKQIERLKDGSDSLWVILSGEKLEWRVVGAFVTTLSEDSEGKRFVGVSNLAGSGARRWAKKMNDLMVEYARANGCDFVRCYGRRAWGRLLQDVAVVGEHENGHAIFERSAA